MRLWIVLGVSIFMLATVLFPAGVWSATIDDVRKEMVQNARPFWGERPVMYVPMVGSGNMHMPMTNLCVSGGRLRPISEGSAGIDMGPAPRENQYSVVIHSRDGGGYDIFQYMREVTLPACK